MTYLRSIVAIGVATALGGCNFGLPQNNGGNTTAAVPAGAPDSVVINGVTYLRNGAPAPVAPVAPVAGAPVPGAPVAAAPVAPTMPVAPAPALAAPGSNPLLGRWMGNTTDCPIIDFAPATMTVTRQANAPTMGGGPPPGPETISVNYQVNGPLSVIVTAPASRKPPKSIFLTDPAHFMTERCTFQKVG